MARSIPPATLPRFSSDVTGRRYASSIWERVIRQFASHCVPTTSTIMKTSLMMFAVLASAVAAADQCDYAVVGPQLHTLGTEIAECTTATGYNVANTTATPTDEQKAALCTECAAFVTKVSAMTWPDCEMELAGVNQTLTAYFNNMVGQCLTSTSSSGSTATATSGSTATIAAIGSSSSDSAVESGTAASSTTQDTVSADSTAASSSGASSIVASLSVASAAIVSVALFMF